MVGKITNDISELHILLEDTEVKRPAWVYKHGFFFYLRFEVSNNPWTCKIVTFPTNPQAIKSTNKQNQTNKQHTPKQKQQCNTPYCNLGEETPRFRFCERSCKPHPTMKTKNGYDKYFANDLRICIACSPKLNEHFFFIFVFFVSFSLPQNRKN